MKDRAMQALYLLALDPVAETTADHASYGFRKERSPADAVAQCFNLFARKTSAQWVLEGDGYPLFRRNFPFVAFNPYSNGKGYVKEMA
jgi:retron-type reverse transcriptase